MVLLSMVISIVCLALTIILIILTPEKRKPPYHQNPFPCVFSNRSQPDKPGTPTKTHKARQLKKKSHNPGTKIRKHLPKPFKIVAYTLLILGLTSLAGSILYTSSILAFIGLGLTFWGALLLYIKPERYVKSTLLDSTTISTLTTLNQIIKEHNPKGKPVYLPPRRLEEIKTGKTFIPYKKETTMPPTEEVAQEKIFLKNPKNEQT